MQVRWKARAGLLFAAGFSLAIGPLAIGAAVQTPALAASGNRAAAAKPVKAARLSKVATGTNVLVRGPGKVIQQSSNWSGYAETTGGYTSVTGTWVVPTATPSSGTKLAAQWIGIDGDGNNNLIQTGTQVITSGGQVSYGVWWEILPASETVIQEPVAPGQTMTASIVEQSAGTWVITISNGSWTFTITKSYSGVGASVEWIVEAPEVGGSIAKIAKTTNVTFSGLKANGRNPKLISADAIELVQNTKVRESPSAPGPSGNSFTLAYGKKPPPAP